MKKNEKEEKRGMNTVVFVRSTVNAIYANKSTKKSVHHQTSEKRTTTTREEDHHREDGSELFFSMVLAPRRFGRGTV